MSHIRKNSLSTIILLVLLEFLTLTSAEAVDDFSGDWKGFLKSNGFVTAGLSARLSQDGSSVSGRITFSNTECGTFYNLPVTGSISNNQIAISIYVYCPDDNSDNKVKLTNGVLNNNTLSGSYTIHSDGEFYQRGTFTATRSINYIQSSAGAGGTISPSGRIPVNAGTDQTFKIVPDNGYEIKDVKVDGTSIGAKTSHTFQNLSANHTITAAFEILPKTASSIVPNIVVPLLLDGK